MHGQSTAVWRRKSASAVAGVRHYFGARLLGIHSRQVMYPAQSLGPYCRKGLAQQRNKLAAERFFTQKVMKSVGCQKSFTVGFYNLGKKLVIQQLGNIVPAMV